MPEQKKLIPAVTVQETEETKTQKIEIVNFPKNWIAIISLVISLCTLAFVFYNYFFIERASIGIKDFSIIPIYNENKLSSVYMSYLIFNSGKIPAEDLHFVVYTVSIDDNTIVNKTWDDTIPGDIFPDTAYPFGGSIFPSIGEERIGKQVALIFEFSYKDKSIWTKIYKKDRINKLYFKYSIGTNSAGYLLGSEMGKVKDRYETLKNNH